VAERQDIDALLVGALYGEIDPAEKARLDAHLSSHPEDRATLESLERTRAQVRRSLKDMPAAEPPSSLSSVLLAAARESRVKETGKGRGAVEVAQPGLWSRFVEWMRPIAGHPAFAAAAVLVLVAGTAVALWVKDGGGAAEPRAPQANQQAAAPEKAADRSEYRAPEAPSREQQAAGEGVPAVAMGSGSAYADHGDGADTTDKDAFADKNRDVAPATGTDRKGGKATATAAGSKPKKSGSEIGMMEAKTTAPGDDLTIQELNDESDGAGAAGTGAATHKAAAQDPGTAPRQANAEDTEWATTQHNKLVKLVGEGKCPAAARLGVTIKKRAPEYYAANVANDREIRPCLQYIEAESQKQAEKNYKSRAHTTNVAPDQGADDADLNAN
jgi:anti-sigma factor RsiW